MYFILGHTEEIEAQCMKRVVHLAIEGLRLGMPMIVDVHPIGPRVVLTNKAIELGVSYAIEGGADGIVVPWPGAESFETILNMCGNTPVWVKLEKFSADADELSKVLQLEAAGFWLTESILSASDPAAVLKSIQARVHLSVETHSRGGT
jgi:DhnA family fructose-bisphosphate aldolase class Ia